MSKIDEKNKAEGFFIKKGRSDEQFIHTNFNLLDCLNEYSDCETLGFYIAFKSYINRKDNTKENQITYSQKYLEKQMNIGWRKYYKHLSRLFNLGLIDIEKTATIKFFINYNIAGKDNPLVEKSILYFSTLDNIDITLKDNLEYLISDHYPEIQKDLIKIISIKHENSYIIHDIPPTEAISSDGKFISYRCWDTEMEKFQRGPNKSNENSSEIDKDIPLSRNGKDPSSRNGKDPSSRNGKDNIIKELNNSIIELPNSIINQSSDNEKFDIVDNKVELNRLIDLDKQLLENNFKTYKDLINYVGIDKNCFEYPYTEYIDAIKRAIEEMYYFDYTKIKNRKIGRFDVISKLQNIQYDIIKTCIDKVIESSKSQVIEYPVAFIKSTLFNEIDEYSAKIQSQINYDFSDLPSNNVNDRLTRFHNFIGRTSNYTADELEEIANRKRKEYSSKKKTL